MPIYILIFFICKFVLNVLTFNVWFTNGEKDKNKGGEDYYSLKYHGSLFKRKERGLQNERGAAIKVTFCSYVIRNSNQSMDS
jgi:hypothetical protein